MSAIVDSQSMSCALNAPPNEYRFTLYSGSAQRIALALFNETLRVHLSDDEIGTLFLESTQSYTDHLVLVRRAIQKRPCIVVFEALNDPRYIQLVEALLRRGFTVWAGVESFDSADALKKFMGLVQPGWNPYTGDYTSMQVSHLATQSLRSIEKMADGVEVIELTSEFGQNVQILPFHEVSKNKPDTGITITFWEAQDSGFQTSTFSVSD